MEDWERDLHDDPVGPRCIREHDAKDRPGKQAVARVGRLYWTCYGRVRRDIVALAELVRDITAATAPSIVSPIRERVAGSKAPRLPIDADGIDALNEVWPLLTRWVAYWTEQYRLRPPTVLAEAIGRGVDNDRVPAGWSAGTLVLAANDAAEWLLLAGSAWSGSAHVGAMYEEVAEMAKTLGGRWNHKLRPERRSDRPCRKPINGIPSGCGVGRVVVGWDGDAPYAKCNACGWRPEDEAEYAAATA